MNTMNAVLWSTLAGLMIMGGQALADDTEVFFPPENGAQSETVRPNILFIMDTSGSMGGTDGTSSTRLDKVKNALSGILSEMSSNTNVGLMRLSDDEGGPILFPVAPIDASADSVEQACLVEPDVTLIGRAAGETGETAQEEIVSGVTLQDPPVLAAGLLSVTNAGTAQISLRGRSANGKGQAYDDAEQRPRDKNAKYKRDTLRLGERDVGLRFPGVPIPKGAVITSAVLKLTISDDEDDPTVVTVYGESVADSLDFRDNPTVIGRARTAASSTPWAVPVPLTGTAVYTSPDISGVVDEIINGTDGWESGNALTLLLSGTGEREVLGTTEGNERPELVIQYEIAARPETDSQVGMRFNGMNIPQGVRIKSAHIDFVPALVNVMDTSFVLRGEKSADSLALTTGLKVLSGRPRTTASTAWPDVGDWDVIGGLLNPDVVKRSPDISNVIQEIVDQTDWCGGNALTVFLESAALNTGLRNFFSGLSGTDIAPTLRVTYSKADPQADRGCRQSIGVASATGSSDDAEERVSDGRVSLGSSDLEISTDGSDNQVIGIRFNEVQIAQGGEVLEATINLFAKGTSFGTSALTITVEDDPDPGPFSSASRHLSDRSRNTVAGSVSWAPDNFEEDGEQVELPDISALIQEVVNQPGWKAGNSVVVFIKGIGTRRVWSSDGSSAMRPSLFFRANGIVRTNTVRQRLLQLVAELDATGYTPVSEVLTEAAHYYRGDEVFFGRTRGSGKLLNDGDGGSGQDDLSNARKMRISHCASYTGGIQIDPPGCTPDDPNSSNCEQQRIEGNPKYISPITDPCQSSNIVLLTDGLPNQNNKSDLVRAITGTSCSGNDCGPALAKALAENDQRPGLVGNQNINTYTIGFADFGARSYLEDIAEKGNGTFSLASDAEALADSFREIIALILDQDTSFVAPGVTVNSFNRLTHLDQLYFALFQPQAKTNWDGNLKRFRLAGQPGRIVDANGADAIDPATGYFGEDVTSFWTDSGPDGGEVTRGGAAGEMPLPLARNVYTNVAGSALSDLSNRVDKTNLLITKELLGMVGEEDLERARVLDWARGVDVNDDDSDGLNTDMRHPIGDPLHSGPLLVNYGDSADSLDVAVFMGTNEGFLHSFDARTGKENFAFVPKELLKNLRAHQKDTGAWYSRPYGMDGPLVSYQSGNKTLVLAGMRRGGRSYYALDVSNRLAPTVAWSITGGATAGFSELGQTWSKPIPATVMYAGSPTDVLIFGGGYDDGQDVPNSPPITDSTGRAVYVVRASNGEMLWSAGPADAGTDYIVNDMQASVPATPGVVDLNEDGLVDRIYLADTNAKIFRFDIDPENGGRSSFAEGGMIAHLGGSDAAGNRRFYNSPDVSISFPPEGAPLLTIAIGSGYRAHPLEEGVQDRFYVLFDPDVTVGKKQMFDLGPIDDPLNDLYDASANKIGDSDPAVSQAELAKMLAKRGSYINLRDGEKALSVSRTFNNTVMFSTFEPGTSASSTVCSAGVGTARLYVMNVLGMTPADDLNNSGGDLTTGDRDKELDVRGIPPAPVVLFPDSGDKPIEPVVFIGTERYDPKINVMAQKTTWETREPDVIQLEVNQ